MEVPLYQMKKRKQGKGEQNHDSAYLYGLVTDNFQGSLFSFVTFLKTSLPTIIATSLHIHYLYDEDMIRKYSTEGS